MYYTGYKTAQMRREFAHWTFGVVSFDPNDPAQAILPNTWKFHQHEPWIRKRANGKDGEWLLRDAYKKGRAPKVFGLQVKEWASNLRPGSFVAVAVRGIKTMQCGNSFSLLTRLCMWTVSKCWIRGASVVGSSGVVCVAGKGTSRWVFVVSAVRCADTEPSAGKG